MAYLTPTNYPASLFTQLQSACRLLLSELVFFGAYCLHAASRSLVQQLSLTSTTPVRCQRKFSAADIFEQGYKLIQRINPILHGDWLGHLQKECNHSQTNQNKSLVSWNTGCIRTDLRLRDWFDELAKLVALASAAVYSSRFLSVLLRLFNYHYSFSSQAFWPLACVLDVIHPDTSGELQTK
jgi:hypothetical protein